MFDAKYELKEVFAAGGVPTVTYVDRADLNLEGKIKRASNVGQRFNVVTGPTKSGKSVLCKKVLGQGKLVSLEGGQIETADEFWIQLAHRLKLAATISETDTLGGKASGTIKPGWILGSLINVTASLEGSGTLAKNSVLARSLKIAAIDALLKSKAVLLVDDFHYLPDDTQREVIQSFKQPVAEGLMIFLLAVPHRGFDPMTVEKEVEGRFKHIQIPTWNLSHLKEIAAKGFPALKVQCPAQVVEEMSEQSVKNPLLMQEICAELCAENEIWQTQDKIVTLKGDKLAAAYKEVAESKGFPTYQQLKIGPQAGKIREQRLLRDGTAEDIYSLIMMALSNTGAKFRTSYDELRAEMRKLVDDDGKMPQKNEITSALSHMNQIAKKKIEGEPAIEWVKEQNEVVIVDPFLTFFMRHADHREMTE